MATENVAELDGPLRRKLFHLCRQMHRAAKKARGFELQRLVRRLRNVRTKAELTTDPNGNPVPEPIRLARTKEAQKWETQLESFKKLDMDDVAFRSLAKAIQSSTEIPADIVVPSHILSLSKSLSDALVRESEQGGPSAMTPSQQRLAKSRALVTAVSEAVSDLVDYIKNKAKNDKDSDSSIDDVDSEEASVKPNNENEDENGSMDVMHEDHEMRDESANSDSHEQQTTASKAPTQQKQPKTDTNKPTVSRSKPSSDRSSSKKMESMFVASLGEGLDEDDDDESDESDSDTISLAVSDVSMSDFSDYDNATKNSNKKKQTKKQQEKPRKQNRMGQRARREMWEKMYGKNAKHVQKMAQTQRRSAPATNRNAASRHGRHPAAMKPSAQDTSDLHPSWQAKKNAKPVIAAFKGTKTTFGDDSGPKTSSSSAPEQLHPSWEAKKRAKALEEARRQQAAKPTKITFDD